MKSKFILAGALALALVPLVLILAQRPSPPVAASLEGYQPRAPAPSAAPLRDPDVNAEPAVKLPPSAEQLWQRPVAEPAFAQFADWANRYIATPATDRAALEAEGVALARARRTALADLIITKPERALELVVPDRVRGALPGAVQHLLEEPVNTRGDYEVVCVLPPPGRKQPGPALIRSARIGGQTFQVFTFGKGLDYVTRTNVPLNGIAVPVSAAAIPPTNPIGLQPDKLMALHPSPARRLDDGAAGAGRVGVQFAGRTYGFDTLAEAEAWAANVTAASWLEQPQPPANLPTAESSYTEGRKRFLLMRVDFPDYTVDVFPTNDAVAHMRDMSNFLGQISYYRHIIAGVGQGTDITPVMRMTNNASAYDNAGLSKLYPEARAAARDVYGYDLDKYDFFFVCTGDRPSYSYAGLGYVGGVGYHLANGYFDVRTSAHEFGHNLGLGHANWWDTGGRSTIGPGSGEEYGDPFDTMGGSGGGNRHFSASFKNRLGWIPDSDALTVTASGRFRLHAHDIATAPVGLRALRLNRASGDPYWIEFRQLWTANKALMNGINFRWAGGSSQLLDMTPGSAGGKDDHPLTIGRTFSDWSRNFHVTPLRKANTYPESVDVAIYFGPFPTNQPPTVIAAAPATAAVGQTVTFTAQATDPNGDALAYSWDFGDGDYSVDNSAVTTHSFGSAGEYYVEVTASDMKGGVGRDAVIVTVGSPTTFTISGRVLDAQGRPVPGVRVSTSSSRYAFTESDGTYAITRLAAGSYTVSAVEPVTDALTFLNLFFNNPVTVGPDFPAADFIASSNSFTVYTPLLPKLSVWKYLDDGSDQGTNWIAPAFNDAGWSNGAAILGYGEGNETTVLRYGTNANNKHITYYFRKSVTLTNLATYTNLLLEVLRDDGVVVYFNGREVFRDNLPAGVISNRTTAVNAVEPGSYLTTNLPVSLLVEGANVIAAEIHQVDPTSSDINFDLALSGLSASNVAGLTMVYVASPAHNQSFTSPTNILITASAQSMAGSASLVEFYADGAKIGQDAAAPFSLTWVAPPDGAHTLHVVATFGSLVVTSAPVVITVAPPAPVWPPVTLNLVPTNAQWAFFCTNVGAPAGWEQPAFDDSSWRRGGAKLGFASSTAGFTTVFYGGPSNARYPAAYFRHAFVVPDPSAVTNLTLSLQRDDGAVLYLNGVEVLRDNISNGIPVTYSLLASNASDNGNTLFTFDLSPAHLAVGTNVLAAEVHQSSATSSDLAFALGLTGLASTNRPRGVWLTAPAPGATISLPGTVLLAADVVAGGTLGVSRVEFFSDGVKLGEAGVRPYNVTWANPPSGPHQLVAVATDSAGSAITSAPVSVTVLAPPLGTALISFGEVWKYLDDGSDQGTNWTARTFDDRAWLAGAARLGYGGDGEVTTLSFGTNPSVKHITYYFRRAFTVPNPSAFDSLLLRLVRDDGAVVYLNGQEVYRSGLLAGLVTFNSLATNSVGEPEETTVFDVPLSATALRAGTNVVAVEVHQAGVGSSDLGFDLALLGLTLTNPVAGVYLSSPAQGARFHVPASVPLAAFASAPGGVDRVDYFAGAVKIGQSAISPYSVTWSFAPEGVHTLTAVALTGGGLTLTSPPVTITVDSPPPLVTPVYTTLIPALSEWKFWDNVTPVGAGWMEPGYDDTAWPSGPARFGWGFDGERTLLTEGRVTHYFRRWFHLAEPGQLLELIFQLARDDGAVVYLNGREVFRSNMPAGPVAAGTLASATVNTPDETTFFETALAAAGSGLTAGSNLLAVELHQASSSSSDAGFDLQLIGAGTSESRIYFTSPSNNAVFGLHDTVPVEAVAWFGSAASITRLEYFVDNLPLAEGSGQPFRYGWSNLPPRAHALTARATDALGRALVTEPLPILVSLPLVTNTFIPSNAFWKYLDDGSNQGTNWTQLTYNDSAWSNGYARLGYGGDGEVTTIRSTRANGSRIITTYFRRAFAVPPGAVFTNLVFNLVRDDGAVVWLNGHELFRSNLDPAPPVIGYTDFASAAVSGGDEQRFFAYSVPATWLQVGTNVVAVEIHQSSTTSSDVGFNLELVAVGYVDDTTQFTLQAALDEGTLELRWPVTAYGFRLYTTTQLGAPGAWVPVSVLPVIVNGQNIVTVPATGHVQLFRLGQP